MHRRLSLDEALHDVEAGSLANAARIVVSRRWWDALSTDEQNAYHRRSEQRGIELSTDDRISRHFVEIIGAEGEPPLSSESRT